MSSCDPIIIESRFRGPGGMGNGGYVSGRVAEAIGGPAKIRLHAPTPLDKELQLHSDAAGARLVDGATLLVEGEPLGKPLDLAIPAPPSEQSIADAKTYFPTARHHMAPSCFVCGPDRDCADALCLFTGRDPTSKLAADRWTPAADLAGSDGALASRYLWAALDCPSYFATGLAGTALLAGMAARIERHPMPGERLTVTGWPIDSEGRKHHAGSVIHDGDGAVIACARALWIEVKA